MPSRLRHGGSWYQARLLREAGSRVLLEAEGVPGEREPFWLSRDSDRIWRGSYRGSAWRYLVCLWQALVVALAIRPMPGALLTQRQGVLPSVVALAVLNT
jgi:hypothetical protein